MRKVKEVNGNYIPATLKKHLLSVIDAKNPKFFGTRIKVNRKDLLITSLGDNTYELTEFTKRPGFWGDYVDQSKWTLKVIE